MARRIISSTGKAGNTNIDFVVPAGNNMRLCYAEQAITTDATVANRQALIQVLDDSSAVVCDYHAGALVTASLSNMHHQWMQGTFRETAFFPVGSNGSIQCPFGSELWLLAGWTLRFKISAGVAGDSFGVRGVVEYAERK